MSKVYLMPVNRLNLEDLRKLFKQAKADAREKAASTVEGGKQDDSKTA